MKVPKVTRPKAMTVCFTVLILAILAVTILTGRTETKARRACEVESQKVTKERDEILAKYKTVVKLPTEQLREFITNFVKGRQPRSSTDVARLIAESIVKRSDEYDLPPGLLIGIIEAESRYDPMAFSSAKCRGLMQVNFKIWAKALNIPSYRDLYNIDPNIKYGSRILAILLKKEGSLSKALNKYLGANSAKYRSKVLNTFAEFELEKHQFLGGRKISEGKEESIKQ